MNCSLNLKRTVNRSGCLGSPSRMAIWQPLGIVGGQGCHRISSAITECCCWPSAKAIIPVCLGTQALRITVVVSKEKKILAISRPQAYCSYSNDIHDTMMIRSLYSFITEASTTRTSIRVVHLLFQIVGKIPLSASSPSTTGTLSGLPEITDLPA